MRIAVMQPYFIPYAGYFRLFCATDLVVFFDCVQFIRRGWIHRNRLPNGNGLLQWLTLPLQKAPQTIRINELSFLPEANLLWPKRLQTFPQLLSPSAKSSAIFSVIEKLTKTPVDFIIDTLRCICEMIKLPFHTIRSSSLNLPMTLKGEDRIIEIAKYFGATRYINLSGGHALYDGNNFAAHDIKLQFLPPYRGSTESILQTLILGDLHKLRHDIMIQSCSE